MKSGRGGFRENAGRKTGWPSGRGFDETKIIRVPKEFASQLLQIAHKLDAGKALDSVAESRQELNSNSLSEKDLVTKSIDDISINLVTKSNNELDLDSWLEKELVTESVQGIINSVKDILTRWRQRSDEAKTTSPKSERWAKARQMLNELEPVVFGVASEKLEFEVAVIDPSLVSLQVDLDTESEKHQLNDLVTHSTDTNTELSELAASPQVDLDTESDKYYSTDSVTNSNTSNTEPLESVTESEVIDLSENVAQSPNQLNLLSETEYQTKDSKHELKELISLTRAELAERFGIKIESLGNRITGKMASTFSEWSKKRDPDGITWQYYPENKLFFPITETVTNSEAEVMSGKEG